MRDVAYVAVVVGFFGLCAAYVSACARLVGHEVAVAADEPEAGSGEASPAVAPVAGAGR